MHPDTRIIKNENGSVIVIALLILIVLTIIGLTATSNSRMELNVTRNSQIYKRDFYAADSGWRHSAMWLDRFDVFYPPIKLDGFTVKFAGNDDVANDTLDPAFPAGTDDSNIAASSNLNPYWFKIEHLKNEISPGSSDACFDSHYRTTSYGGEDGIQQVETQLVKLSCVGGGSGGY